MRQIASLRAKLEPLQRLASQYRDIAELRALLAETPDDEMAREVETLARSFLSDLDRYELQILLSGPHDDRNAIVEIGAGAGGTEACDWAAMLLRMYMRWAERSGFRVEMLAETPGDVTGYRSVSFLVEGATAYGYLKGEQGVHRLVRISPFDASARRHTSFAMVEVLPEVAAAEVDIKPDDLRVETFRSSGAGGQHVNKTESAVRVVHLPTGIVVACQNERSQHKNKAMAMTILTARLADLERDKTDEHLRRLKGELTPADWGHQIRSYVLQPYTLVKDTRTSLESGNVQAILDGDLDAFISAYLRIPRPTDSPR
jgi:peptide chain release factor 2